MTLPKEPLPITFSRSKSSMVNDFFKIGLKSMVNIMSPVLKFNAKFLKFKYSWFISLMGLLWYFKFNGNLMDPINKSPILYRGALLPVLLWSLDALSLSLEALLSSPLMSLPETLVNIWLTFSSLGIKPLGSLRNKFKFKNCACVAWDKPLVTSNDTTWCHMDELTVPFGGSITMVLFSNSIDKYNNDLIKFSLPLGMEMTDGMYLEATLPSMNSSFSFMAAIDFNNSWLTASSVALDARACKMRLSLLILIGNTALDELYTLTVKRPGTEGLALWSLPEELGLLTEADELLGEDPDELADAWWLGVVESFRKSSAMLLTEMVFLDSSEVLGLAISATAPALVAWVESSFVDEASVAGVDGVDVESWCDVNLNLFLNFIIVDSVVELGKILRTEAAPVTYVPDGKLVSGDR